MIAYGNVPPLLPKPAPVATLYGHPIKQCRDFTPHPEHSRFKAGDTTMCLGYTAEQLDRMDQDERDQRADWAS